MNFLAHLHIAEHCESQFLGNLLGDFVKGDPSERFSKQVVHGIQLHRFVDRYTDTHDEVVALKRFFPKALRRFSPIALDMFWDHCLANDWRQHHPKSLAHFLNHAEAVLNRDITQLEPEQLPPRYRRVHHYMWAEQWLLSYKEMDNIVFALERMSMRSDRMAPLADCSESLKLNYDELRKAFDRLYPQVLSESKLVAEQLR